MVEANPILGVGLNTFDYHIVDYGPYSFEKLYAVFGEMFPVVHNIYMIIWSEQGTVGLLLFLAMHASILWIAAKNLRYRGLSDRIYMVSLGAGCAMLGIMLDGFSSFFMKVETFGRIYWLFVGLIVAAHYWNVRNDRFAAERRRRSEAKPVRQEGQSSRNRPESSWHSISLSRWAR